MARELLEEMHCSLAYSFQLSCIHVMFLCVKQKMADISLFLLFRVKDV